MTLHWIPERVVAIEVPHPQNHAILALVDVLCQGSVCFLDDTCLAWVIDVDEQYAVLCALVIVLN